MSEKGISLKIVEFFAWSGYTSAATPKIRRTFAMFDPMTFHSASSVCHLKPESTFTNNSGAEVPKATIVRPITKGEIPNFFARWEAHTTKISAPLIRMKKPIIRYMYCIIALYNLGIMYIWF